MWCYLNIDCFISTSNSDSTNSVSLEAGLYFCVSNGTQKGCVQVTCLTFCFVFYFYLVQCYQVHILVWNWDTFILLLWVVCRIKQSPHVIQFWWRGHTTAGKNANGLVLKSNWTGFVSQTWQRWCGVIVAEMMLSIRLIVLQKIQWQHFVSII